MPVIFGNANPTVLNPFLSPPPPYEAIAKLILKED
jgi:hypothetical protein